MDAKQYPVTRTDAEWRKLLTPEQYQIMRAHGMPSLEIERSPDRA